MKSPHKFTSGQSVCLCRAKDGMRIIDRTTGSVRGDRVHVLDGGCGRVFSAITGNGLKGRFSDSRGLFITAIAKGQP